MRITGYGTPIEKECNYPTIRCLLRKHQIPTSEIDDLLDKLKGEMIFCLVIDEPTCTLILDQLPEGTTELLIETKCTTKC